MYLGSQKQMFEVIYDTGSAWLWVNDKQCSNCPNYRRFDSQASSTYERQN